MPAKLTEAKIAEGLAALKGWKYDPSSASLRKSFKLKDHITAMGFLTKVAMAAEAMDHHPDVHFVYSTVEFALSTHSAGGVTRLDLELAAKIESYR
ncbi:MAG TPA: 4a-hydroxytetrahydrobiopterin dehydratase [Tepidiformaceae bacterium]|nr:4a-hydroxytetrahydrobiopterin dehydratase [Tepidiformaceae bacterium]